MTLEQQLAEALEQNLVLSKQTDHTILDLSNYVDSLEQQLSAALAACKLKDEKLEKIRGHIGLYNLFSCVGSDSYDPECADLNVGKCIEIAIEALTIQPDDSALKAWLGDPAGWVWERRYNNGGYSREVFQFESEALEMAEDGKNLPRQDTVTPLYSPKGLK